MSTKSIKKNYIYNLTYQVLLLLTPLITAPYLSRVFGADGVGIYSYAEAISSYFVLFATLGLTTFGQREISYVQNDYKKRTIIFWETYVIEVVSSCVCIVIYIFFIFSQSQQDIYIVLIFNLLAALVNITWFFQGIEEFGKIVLRNIFFKVVNIIYIFLFIKTRTDLILYLLGTSLFTFLSNASLWLTIPKYITKPTLRELHPLRHIKTILSLFIPTVAIQVYTVLDKTMIGLITKDTYENGYYEQALKMSKMVLTLVTALGTVMIPRIGHYFSNGDTELVKKYMYRAYRFVWFLGLPLCIGLIMVSGIFVPWFLGSGYDKVVPLMYILSFLIPIIGINNITGMQYLIPTKRQNKFTLTVLIGAVINFILNLFLIKLFQSYGAALASVIAETIITVVQIYIVRKELSPKEIIKCGGHYYIAGVIMAIILYIFRKIFMPSFISVIILTILGATSYFCSLFIIRDRFFCEDIVVTVEKAIKKYIWKL